MADFLPSLPLYFNQAIFLKLHDLSFLSCFQKSMSFKLLYSPYHLPTLNYINPILSSCPSTPKSPKHHWKLFCLAKSSFFWAFSIDLAFRTNPSFWFLYLLVKNIMKLMALKLSTSTKSEKTSLKITNSYPGSKFLRHYFLTHTNHIQIPLIQFQMSRTIVISPIILYKTSIYYCN